MTKPHLPLALVLCASACGSIETGAPADSADAGPGDHTSGPDAGGGEPGDAPVVTSTSPADGAGGVAPDAAIVIAFSAPMDAASVEAAWSSPQLPAGSVGFAWNAGGDTLTVTPDDPLPVAEGSGADPDAVEAIAIAFAIGEGARDAAGVALAEPLEVEFRTARRLTLEVPYHAPLSDCRYSDGSAAVGTEVLYAGDDYLERQIKMVVSFALPALPRGAAVERAIFVADQRGTTGGQEVYQDLGDLRLTHVRFKSLSGSFGAAALGGQSLLSDSDRPGVRSVPVTAAVVDDRAEGLAYAQFRAEFPTATDGDDVGDIAAFERPGFALALTYLAE